MRDEAFMVPSRACENMLEANCSDSSISCGLLVSESSTVYTKGVFPCYVVLCVKNPFSLFKLSAAHVSLLYSVFYLYACVLLVIKPV